MIITTLLTGRLIADPEQRTIGSGNPFVTVRLVSGTHADSVFVSGIAFGATSGLVAALAKGDTLAITGRTKPKSWAGKDGNPKAGLDVVADRVLTPYHLKRRRAAMSGATDETPVPRPLPSGRSANRHEREPELIEDEEWLRGVA